MPRLPNASASPPKPHAPYHRLPRSRSNDGTTIDLEEIRHKPLPARSPRGDHAVTDVVATLKAKVAELEVELAAEQQRSAGTGRTTSACASAPTAWSPPKTEWSPNWKISSCFYPDPQRSEIERCGH
jgi:hypothetical protein